MKKTLKTIIILAFALVILLPVNSFAQPIGAVDEDEDEEEVEDVNINVNIKKILIKSEENSITPEETFNFTLTPVTVPENTILNNLTVYTGKDDLLVFNPDSTSIPYQKGDSNLEKEKVGLLHIDGIHNEDVEEGIYRYKLTEVAGSTNGMSYATTSYIIDVYVTPSEYDVNEFEVKIYKEGENSIIFDSANSQSVTIVFENIYTTHTLTVTKTLAGNAAVLTDRFDIEVTVNGAPGETYKASNGETLTSGETHSFTLGNGESVNIYGLSEGDTYTVTEPNKKDYTATGEVITATPMGNSNHTVAITNTHNIYNLTVTNKLDGNAAVSTDVFNIIVTVNGPAGKTYETDQGVTLTSGVPQPFEIGDKGSVNIIGLSEGDTYIVTEPDSKDYTVTGLVTTAKTMGTENKKVEITNTLNAIVPTGIVETFGAFVIMIAVTGGFAYTYFKLNKKRA